MNPDHYIGLLYKKLSGNLAKEEGKVLEQWLQTSDENKSIAKEVTTSWELGAGFERRNADIAIDLDKEFSRLETMLPEGKKQVHQATRSTNYTWLKIAAGLALLVGCFFLVKNNLTTTPDWVTVQTAAQERQEITLPDGSTIHLNENTTFRYPEVFNQQERIVHLEGEAFFEVTKNPEQAFHVKTPRGKISVLGTSFNVKDLGKGENMAVQVLSGKVKFQASHSEQSEILVKSEKAFYDKKRDKIIKERDAFMNEVAWHTRKLRFSRTSLKEVVKTLGNFYGVELILSEKTMLDCSYSASFKQEKPLANILETFEDIYKIKVVKNGEKRYRLEGGVCSEE